MSKSTIGIGLTILGGLYLLIDTYAGNDPKAAQFLTMAAGFVALQTILLMTDRH